MIIFSSVQFSHAIVPDSLWPHGQQARLPWLSPTHGAYSNLMSFELVMSSNCLILCRPSSSSLESFPESGSFQISRVFGSGSQSFGASASASVLPMNSQGWFPLGWTDFISLLSKRLSRVFSNTTIQKHQSFGTQFCLESNSHIHTWLLEKP